MPAVVEIKPEPDVPAWFLSLMERYGFRSFVAVPLIGQTRAVGILCAYYRDICLFDQGTLERLTIIGRMVGAATEKSAVADRAATQGVRERAADEFLRALTSAAFTKLQLYGFLAKIAEQAIGAAGVVCGPVRNGDDNQLVMTIADGAGVPSSAISQRFPLSAPIARRLSGGKPQGGAILMRSADWGAFAALVRPGTNHALCAPMNWRGELQGAVVLWRPEDRPFEEDEDILLHRLAGMAALASNAS